MRGLSKTQQEVLSLLQENGSFLYFMPYMGKFNPKPYYFISGTLKNVRYSTVQALFKLGYLVKMKDKGYGDHEMHLASKP